MYWSRETRQGATRIGKQWVTWCISHINCIYKGLSRFRFSQSSNQKSCYDWRISFSVLTPLASCHSNLICSWRWNYKEYFITLNYMPVSLCLCASNFRLSVRQYICMSYSQVCSISRILVVKDQDHYDLTKHVIQMSNMIKWWCCDILHPKGQSQLHCNIIMSSEICPGHNSTS